MYDNVIVAVDGQPGGRDAAALARRLAVGEAEFTLVYVRGPAGRHSRHSGRGDLDTTADEGFPELLERELELCGPRATARRVDAASPGEGLDQAAEETGADLIVVGSSRQHGIRRLLSGDDVCELLHRTARPVAVAPQGYGRHPRPIARVAVAVDARPTSRIAMRHASAVSEEAHATLTPVSIVEPHYYTAGWTMVAVPSYDPQSEMTAARERLGTLGGPELELVYGVPGEELARLSERVDLLVCGSRHNGSAKRLILGSTSEYLTRHACSPLLITPAVEAAAVPTPRRRQLA